MSRSLPTAVGSLRNSVSLATAEACFKLPITWQIPNAAPRRSTLREIAAFPRGLAAEGEAQRVFDEMAKYPFPCAGRRSAPARVVSSAAASNDNAKAKRGSWPCESKAPAYDLGSRGLIRSADEGFRRQRSASTDWAVSPPHRRGDTTRPC